MRSKNRVGVLVFGTAIAAVCTGACNKSAETKRKEVSEAELRSAEAERHVLDEKHDYFAAIRREQLDLRARVQEDIDELDKQLASLKVEFRDGGWTPDRPSKNSAKITELLEHRKRLEEDATAVERADDKNWETVKAAVEKDLISHRPGGRI
ncbi:MAG: hypothetical protein K0S65_4256 [Labilithrix sp.]|nr:hypothetical protein [Labilithrix sp.]